MGCFVLTTKLDMYGTIEGGGEGRRQGVKNSELVFLAPLLWQIHFFFPYRLFPLLETALPSPETYQIFPLQKYPQIPMLPFVETFETAPLIHV